MTAMDDPGPLGVIAGGGALPRRLLSACDAAGRAVFVVGFEGQTDPETWDGRPYLLTRPGAAGRIIGALRAHGVRELVLIGSLRRPGLAALRPDWRAARFLAQIGLRALGDDGLLKAVRAELEAEGFTVCGVQDFVTGLLAHEGALGRLKPKRRTLPDITRGIAVARELGRLDVGQAVVVRGGVVLGVEGTEGTDALIRRCAGYGERTEGQSGVLVKLCKPQQDRALDLPAIGPDTVQACAQAGLAGIAVLAGRTLVIDAPQTAALADRLGLFVVALSPEPEDGAP